MTCQVLKRGKAPDLCYDIHQGRPGFPTVLFLSGYRGDLQGAKGLALAAHIPSTPLGLVRFDYRGVGKSGGDFKTARLSDWIDDARDILNQIVPPGPVIVVGSSMGGWLGLHLMIENPDRVTRYIGIAAAPDFTVAMAASLTDSQRHDLATTGWVTLPSNTPGYDPYHLSQEFLTDGNRWALLGQQWPTVTPMVLIHGDQDHVVPATLPDQIRAAFPQAPCQIHRIKDGDHSLSRPSDLAILYAALSPGT